MANSKDLRIYLKTLYDNGLGKVIGHLEKGISRAKAFGAALRAGMHSAPVRLLRNALAGLVGTLGVAVMQAAKFNVEMARVWTMAGGGISTFRELRKEALGLASDFGIARSEISKGMYNALSAGVDRSGLKEFMSKAAEVAVADGSDISVAIDGITTVINAFNLQVEDTDRVTDLMFQTVRKGKTTFGELAGSLSNTASTAAAADIPLEQILAHIATLTAQGTPTAQATTQIRQSIIGLNKALGDGWSKTMSYQDALKKVWKQSGESQTGLLKLVGSVEAVQAVLGGVGNNADVAAEKLAEMGAAAEGARTNAFNMVQQFRHWEQLWQTISGIMVQAGNVADSRLAPAVTRITEMLREIQNNDAIWEGLGNAVDEAVSNVEKLYAYIRSEEGNAGEVAGAVGQIIEGYLKNGGAEIVSILARWAPLIGQAIGTAAKDAFKDVFSGGVPLDRRKELIAQAESEISKDEFGYAWGAEVLRRFNDLLKEERRRMVDERLKAQGIDLSDAIGNGPGKADIVEGLARLDDYLSAGNSKLLLEQFRNELLGDDGVVKPDGDQSSPPVRRFSESTDKLEKASGSLTDASEALTAVAFELGEPSSASLTGSFAPESSAPDQPKQRPSQMMGGHEFNPLMGDYYSEDLRSPWAEAPGSRKPIEVSPAAQAAGRKGAAAAALKSVESSVDDVSEEVAAGSKGIEQAVATLDATMQERDAAIMAQLNALASRVSTVSSQIRNMRV